MGVQPGTGHHRHQVLFPEKARSAQISAPKGNWTGTRISPEWFIQWELFFHIPIPTLSLHNFAKNHQSLPPRNAFPDAISKPLPQILWLPIQPADKPETSRNTFEGALEIREVHEVRPGRNSKDFDKWSSDDNKRADSCFVVLYGQDFKLRTLSIVAFSPQERNMWIAGLRDMCAVVRSTSYPNVVERWLRKEFYGIQNSHDRIAQKDLKSFLAKLNCKISTAKLMEIFAEVDAKKKNEIGFDSFTRLYEKLMVTPHAIHEIFGGRRFPSSDHQLITLKEFQEFLIDEQQETQQATNLETVATLIKDFLQDVQRDVHEPYLTISEVSGWMWEW